MKSHYFIGWAFIFFTTIPAVKAGIVKIVISKEEPAFGGKTTGPAGPYEKITGKAYAEVDPVLPENARITDIQLVPRNARGMVEYSMDFYILKPLDLQRGNHKLLAEIPNRGGKLFGGFNNSGGGNDPGEAEKGAEGFLMQKGYTIVWCGWDISARSGHNNLTITVPVAGNKDGSSITGISYEYISFDNDQGTSYRLAYPAASVTRDSVLLTVRSLLNDTPQVLPSSAWEYADESTIRLLPAGTAFQQSAIYEFFYRAKDPLVAGLGLAATRDFISFLRYAPAGGGDRSGKEAGPAANPLAGEIRYTFSFAISQPARYMNDFQTLGFNVDEEGRRVFDGIENWLGGGSGVGINYRFAQPGRTERNRQNHLYPEGIFPFAYPVLTDTLGIGRGDAAGISFRDPRNATHGARDATRFPAVTAGRLSGYSRPELRPKVMEINSANEYWVKAASLLHSDLQGNDLPDPDNVRFYLMAGMQHGSGNGASRGECQQLQNPTRAEPALRALFIALDEWVTKGRKPPDSRVPRHADGTAVMAAAGRLTGTIPQAALGWPDIPGVTYTGLITIHYRFDYGPLFRQGIITRYPIPPFNERAYPNFVSKVDEDGNELAGIRLPPVAAPTATLTGWALRRSGFGLNDGGESAGQQVPFAKTKAARLSAGDPRLSLEERYGTHEKYVEAVTKAVKELEARRFLLPQDAQNYIEEAKASEILK